MDFWQAHIQHDLNRNNDSSGSQVISQDLFMHRLDPILEKEWPAKQLFFKTSETVDPCGPQLTWCGSFTDKCNEVVLYFLKRFEVIHNEHVPLAGFAGYVGKLVVLNISDANDKDAEPCRAVSPSELHYTALCLLLFKQLKIKISSTMVLYFLSVYSKSF